MYRLIANSMPMGGPFLLMKLLETLGYPNYAKSAEGQASQTPVAFNYKTAKEALNQMRGENLEMRNEKPSHLSPLTSHPFITVSPFAPWHVPAVMFQQWLEAVPTGHYISGHLPYSAELEPMLSALNYRHVLIWRDPQAILAELVFGGDIMPRFLKADLEPLSLAARVAFFLEGGDAPQLGVQISPFAEICHSMLTWQQDSTCFVVRVEELVNLNKQAAIIADLADFLAIKVDKVACLQAINTFPPPISYLEQLHQVITADRLADKLNHGILS